MRKIFFLLCFLLLSALTFVGWYLQRPLPLPATPFEFSLKSGSSLTTVAGQLAEAGLLDYPWLFVQLGKYQEKASQLKAGHYELTKELTPMQLLEVITEGATSSNVKVKLIEGWTFAQFRQMLAQNPSLRHDTRDWSDARILRELGILHGHPEGLFFPDTYHFAKGSSDLQVMKRAHLTLMQHLDRAWQKRDPSLPLRTPYEALILASIVEKETGRAADRTMISGVFINRLRQGMMLQTDPTVIYGLGARFDGDLRKEHLLTDTPYNTYTRFGLPMTPIALPGLASIEAALNPAVTDALYFVARGDGSSEFSNDLEAHNRAVDKYQR